MLVHQKADFRIFDDVLIIGLLIIGFRDYRLSITSISINGWIIIDNGIIDNRIIELILILLSYELLSAC